MPYLTNIPQEAEEYGICKTLLVRYEVIHLKHILTEVFTRKTVNIEEKLKPLGWDLYRYMEHITHRMRAVHKISRGYRSDVNCIITSKRSKFFPTIDLYKELDNIIVLDFDGVVTSKSFEPLYNLCLDRGRTEICSANPTIKPEYFEKRGLRLPRKIFSCKGKTQKLNTLAAMSLRNDFVFFVDNEDCYLEVAWLLGIKTFKYENQKIVNFSMNTK